MNGSSARTVKNTITADGVRSSLQFPNNRTIGFTHDALHRLAAVTEGGNTIADCAYKGLYVQDRGIGNSGGSRVVKLTFKDQNDLDGYDPWGRIRWMRHYKVSGGADVVKLAYAHDYVSSPKYEEDLWSQNGDKDQLYSYDTLHRLIHFKRGALNQQKTEIPNPTREQELDSLDNLGNWASVISKTNGQNSTPYEDRTHNTANEILTITPEGGQQYSVSHDDAGNLSQDGSDQNASRKFTYDFRNRLLQIKKLDDTIIATYRYDALNRRVDRKVENSGALNEERLYLWDNWQTVEELKKSGDSWPTDRQFIYGGRYIDETLVMDVNTDPQNDNDCTDVGGSKRYLYCENNNWNVMALTDDAGTVKERYEYDPYGAVTVTLDGSSGNTYRFQSRGLDPEHGLCYFRNRYASWAMGRFVARDAYEPEGGGNLYAFTDARPVVFGDPSGLDMVKCPGGKWWFAGAATGGNLVIAGYGSMTAKWTCKRCHKVGHIRWCCGENEVWKQPVYEVPTALGVARTGSLGPGIGGSHLLAAGSVSARTSDDLAGWSWAGINVSVTVVAVGAQAGAKPGGTSGRGGIAAGLGASMSTGITHTSVYEAFNELVRESLPLQTTVLIREDTSCRPRFVEERPPVEVDNLTRPIPRFWTGF